MKRIAQTLAVGLVCLLGAASVFAQDWPQWRGTNRDGKVNGFTAPQAWPAQLKQVWKTTVGFGDSTPALVGNNLYVFTRQGGEEVTLCLNAATGDEVWRNHYEAQAVSGPASSHPGPRSSITVADGKIITLGVGGVLSCLDAASGKELWRKNDYSNAAPPFFVAMSPIVVDGMCVAHLGGKDKGAVIAYDLASGDVKWKWDGDGPAYASPVLMTVEGVKQLVVQTEKNLLGVSVSEGKILWQVVTPPQGRSTNSATPIVDGQIIYYTGQGSGIKAVKIEKSGDAFTYKDVWSNANMNTDFNTPVLKDGWLYGLSSRGNLFCINAQTGQDAWVDTSRSDRFGAIVDAGSVLLALPSTADLIAFKPNGNQYEEVARIKVSDTPIYATPIVAGKRIFVKDKETVALLQIE